MKVVVQLKIPRNTNSYVTCQWTSNIMGFSVSSNVFTSVSNEIEEALLAMHIFLFSISKNSKHSIENIGIHCIFRYFESDKLNISETRILYHMSALKFRKRQQA